MNKKELKQVTHISMERFIRYYLKINNECLIREFKKLSHQELKEVYESLYGIKLKCLPFEIVDIDDVMRGDVLIVDDKKGRFAPYVNPIQVNFDMVVKEGRKKEFESQNKPQLYEDYTDAIDEIALDQNVSSSKIKVLSRTRYDRKGDLNGKY